MMKRERRRTMRRVVGVVAVAVRDRLRDFCFLFTFSRSSRDDWSSRVSIEPRATTTTTTTTTTARRLNEVIILRLFSLRVR